MKLTRDAVAALTMPPGKTDHFEWDDSLPSFGVRLRGKTRSWVVQYRVGKQQRRESLGDIRKVGLEDARKIARQRFAQVELGQDPAGFRQGTGVLLRHVVDKYLDARRDVLRPASYKRAVQYLASYWRPLHGRSLDAVKRADVAAVLLDLTRQHGRSAAGQARSHLSGLFAWAMREGLCETNPVTGSNDPNAGAKPRDRVLDDRELALLWRSAGPDAPVVRLLILLGCRREEVGGLKWSEVNLETGMLDIPGTRIKNGRPLRLPLPEPALQILRAISPEGDFVFGRGVRSWSKLKARIDARVGEIAPWTLHDLRRSFRTNLGRLGVAPHVAELCINHVKGGVEAIYDRHRYQREIGAALALWADHVLQVAEGRPPTLVPLRA